MADQPFCFVISPIGEPGTPIRRDADDLLRMIICPALEIFHFKVLRGDHRSEANQIDLDVIQCVQEADICIADISLYNPNVFYEVGRRDETGKPLILMRAKSAQRMPVDLGTRRYIEYDLEASREIPDVCEQLRNFIRPLVDAGFKRSSRFSLSDITASLQRVEGKLDRLGGSEGASDESGSEAPARPVHADSPQANPVEAFRLAFLKNNIPQMEAALEQLQPRVDRWRFLDRFASLAAAKGSEKAGQIVIEGAREFMKDAELPFKKKVEYLGCLVSYLLRSGRAAENTRLVQELCAQLERISDGEEPSLVSEIRKQRGRLCVDP